MPNTARKTFSEIRRAGNLAGHSNGAFSHPFNDMERSGYWCVLFRSLIGKKLRRKSDLGFLDKITWIMPYKGVASINLSFIIFIAFYVTYQDLKIEHLQQLVDVFHSLTTMTLSELSVYKVS